MKLSQPASRACIGIKMAIMRFAIVILYFITLLGSAWAETQEPPSLQKARTDHLLQWSQAVLREAQSGNILDATPIHEQFLKLNQQLQELPGEVKLQNQRFMADIQLFHDDWQECLFWIGLHMTQSEDWHAASGETLLSYHQVCGSPAAFTLPILARLGRWQNFYPLYAQTLILFEKDPLRVRIKPQVPPPWIIQEDHDINTLKSILSCIDLCQQQGWDPGKEESIPLYLNLADHFAVLEQYAYAADTLEFIETKSRSNEVQELILNLRKKARNRASHDDLY